MAFNNTELDPVDELREVRDGPDRNELRQTYNVGTYEFPSGLVSDPDKQHYIVFLINVRDQSELGKYYRDSGKRFERSTYGDRQTAALETEDIITAGKILTQPKVAGAIAGGLSLLKNAKRIFRGPGEALSAAGEAALTGAAVGGGVALVKSLDSEFLTRGNSLYKIKEVITLHIENSPSVRYGVNYTEKDLGALTGLFAQGSAAAVSEKIGQGAGKEIISRFIAELIKLPSIIPGGSTLADLRELGTRQKTNPFREVLFESVDYRSFNFKYRFFPKDAEESKRVRSIIKKFKLHMHPEISDNKLFYMYPSEFEIKYYYKQAENTFINRIGRCALTGLEVEYGGDQFATFEDGSPVEIGLTLSFRELEQITSQGVKDYGY